MEKLIIIGSGPAGWTAGIYAGRAQLAPLLITGSAPGGQMALTPEIETYPGFPQGIGGQELNQLMQQQAERFGTRVQMDEVTATGVRLKNVKTEEESVLEADGVFIYVGAIPNTGFMEGQVELDERGYILTNRQCHTSNAGRVRCWRCARASAETGRYGRRLRSDGRNGGREVHC